MAKSAKSVFFCQNCGYESAKWMGQCPGCREWNTFAEEKVTSVKTPSAMRAGAKRAVPVRVRDISPEAQIRTKTGIGEFDRVLGGGIVTGSLILIGGDPGIGKSTILLQACRNLAGQGKKILYISGGPRRVSICWRRPI